MEQGLARTAWLCLLALALLQGAWACGGADDCPKCDDCGSPDGGIECSSEPDGCDDIGATVEEQFFGCCFEMSVYWCADGQLKSIDCGASGYTCAYNAEGDYVDCEG